MPKTVINKNKFLQFELWLECHNGCKFCYNKGRIAGLNKAQSLTKVINEYLEDKDVLNYNEVGIIGGEFFNNELEDKNVLNLFYKLFEKISNMHFTKIYITTSLIYDMNKYLIPFLNYLKELNIIEKVLLCTSYDTIYRFKAEEDENLWKSNMLELNSKFPELRLHTETILTNSIIKDILNDKFKVKEFQEKYNTHIDFMFPGAGFFYKTKKRINEELPDFLPTKDLFIKFLKKECIERKEVDINTLLSMELRSSKLYNISSNKEEGFFVQNDRRNKQISFYESGLIDSEDNMYEIANKLALIINNNR